MNPSTNLLRRAAAVRIYDVADRTVLLGPDGGGHELTGDSAALAREVLLHLDAPRSLADVRAHVEALAGGPLERPEVVDDLLALLMQVGAVEAATPARPRGPGARVVLGLTGAVASMHAPGLIQRLQMHGYDVRVAVTDEAAKFVQLAALAALLHRPVVRGLWPTADDPAVPHIALAEWADAVVIWPASATTIARLAAGDHSSVVAAIALATRAPVLVAPSMNPAMYTSPAVQRNLARITEDGLHVAHPSRGLEVADHPDERTPVLGAATPPEVVVQLLAAILRASARGTTPRSAAAWDRVYRTAGEWPWHRDEPDPDMLAALARVAPAPAAVLEVGAGLGVLAAAAARLGHRVVATDLSSAAIAHARARAPDAPVVWVQDDVLDSRVHGAFDVIVDRACLHVLPPEDAPRYAATLTRLLAPTGAILLKVLAGEAAAARRAADYTPEQLRALFERTGAFTVEDAASTLPGPGDAPPARLVVLRRVTSGR